MSEFITPQDELEMDVVGLEKKLAEIALRIEQLVVEMRGHAEAYQAYRMCQAELNGYKEVKSCIQSQLRSARQALGN